MGPFWRTPIDLKEIDTLERGQIKCFTAVANDKFNLSLVVYIADIVDRDRVSLNIWPGKSRQSDGQSPGYCAVE
jgi:hypothetical protein